MWKRDLNPQLRTVRRKSTSTWTHQRRRKQLWPFRVSSDASRRKKSRKEAEERQDGGGIKLQWRRMRSAWVEN